METKVCTKCKVEKTLSQFTNKKWKTCCDNCIKLINKQNYQKIKDTHEYKIRMSAYRETHKEEQKLYDKLRLQNSENVKKIKKYKQKYYEYNWINISLSAHKKRGIIISVTQDEIKEKLDLTHCNICGKLLQHNKQHEAADNSPNIDRINNDMFMDINNIQIVCHGCNRSKGARTMVEYLQYLNMIKSNKFIRIQPKIDIILPKWVEDYSRQWSHNSINIHKWKGHTFTLNINDVQSLLIQTPTCPICGCELKYGVGKSCNSSPTLDRISNKTDNISIDDVWIICHRCNTTKQTFTLDEWKQYAELVCKRFTK